jgi:hypothetical protein
MDLKIVVALTDALQVAVELAYRPKAEVTALTHALLYLSTGAAGIHYRPV